MSLLRSDLPLSVNFISSYTTTVTSHIKKRDILWGLLPIAATSYTRHVQNSGDSLYYFTHYVKLGKKRPESSKRNYYIISPRVIIKEIISIPILEIDTE